MVAASCLAVALIAVAVAAVVALRLVSETARQTTLSAENRSLRDQLRLEGREVAGAGIRHIPARARHRRPGRRHLANDEDSRPHGD